MKSKFMANFGRSTEDMLSRTNYLEATKDKFSVCKRKVRMFRYRIREYLAEFLGTFMLVAIGDGTAAQAMLNVNSSSTRYMMVTVGYGLGMTVGSLLSSKHSVAHVNPSITFANAVLGRFKWSKVPFYLFAQFLGGFCAAGAVFITNFSAINNFDGGIRQTYGKLDTSTIFTTFPKPFVNNYEAFLTEFVSALIFLFGVLAIKDSKNDLPGWLKPIGVGGMLSLIGLSVGWLTSFSLNPARDLGPRIFCAVAGWGNHVFERDNYYFWIPVVAPTLGAIVGIVLYELFMGDDTDLFVENEVEKSSDNV